MRKTLRVALNVILCFVLFCLASNAWADAQNVDNIEETNIIGSGKWGDLNWVLDNNGLLIISGSGEMKGIYEYEFTNWSKPSAWPGIISSLP